MNGVPDDELLGFPTKTNPASYPQVRRNPEFATKPRGSSCRQYCPSRRHLHTSLIASKPYMVEHECTPADGGRKRKAARKRKSMEERTERAAAVKKKKAEKNALVDSEPRSSRNGHNMVTPHRAQATLNHRNSVHAPPSLRIDIRAQGGSLPLRPQWCCCPPSIIGSAGWR